jgi:hypothetical protein
VVNTFLAFLFLLLQSSQAGIKVGGAIPPFKLLSHEGKEFDFNRIKGPKGAAILFFRSADW